MSAKTLRVLYVGSWSRSGSTLLDLILGQIPGFVSVGELRYLWDRGLGERQLCGCGTPVPDCSFWGAVLDAASGHADIDAEEMVELRRRLDNLGRFPWLLSPSKPAGLERDLRLYREVLGRLYRAVQEVSGASVIVDSSKYAVHGRLLSGVPQIDLRTLHLIRDSRAVAYSWTRRKRLPEIAGKERYMPVFAPWKSAVYWGIENLGLHLMSGSSRHYEILRYEDLVAHPVAALGSALERIGIEADLKFLEERRLGLSGNHMAAGNPLRFERGPVLIRPDVEWRGRLETTSRWTVTALTWPLLLRYGFPLRTGAMGAAGAVQA